MKKFAGFIGVTIAMLCVGSWIVTRMVPGPEIARAVWMSALIVVIVQSLAFTIAYLMRPANVIAGWGLGMIVRLIVLVAYGFAGVKMLGLAMEPALLSMAGFFFVSTVIEPVFLKP